MIINFRMVLSTVIALVTSAGIALVTAQMIEANMASVSEMAGTKTTAIASVVIE